VKDSTVQDTSLTIIVDLLVVVKDNIEAQQHMEITTLVPTLVLIMAAL
jgi:hypothetical protein